MMDNKKIEKYFFECLLAVGVILFYYFSQYFADLPFRIFGSSINNFNYIFKTIYLIFFNVLILGIIVFIYRNTLKAHFKQFKKNRYKYFNKYFKLWFFVLIGMIVSNFIIMLLNNGAMANNEEGIREIFDINPIYVYISGVFIAPFMEELIFRFSLRKIFKIDTLFIIMSGLIFGGAHVIGQTESLIDYLYIIPYSIPGFVFGYLYVKSNNIFTSTCMHIFHNGIMLSLQFFVLLFG